MAALCLLAFWHSPMTCKRQQVDSEGLQGSGCHDLQRGDTDALIKMASQRTLPKSAAKAINQYHVVNTAF